MGLIMGLIQREQPELFTLEFGNIAGFAVVYTLASTNINQSRPLGQNVCDNKISD